jgi:protein TonB
MVHAHAALPRLPLDAKRIAATSAVIALHAAVLMLLMMPAQIARPPLVQEEDRPYVPDFKTLPPPPPPPTVQPIREQVTPQPIREQVAIVDPPVEPVDSTVGALDVAMPDVDIAPDNFAAEAAGTSFLQLATLVAPPPLYPRAAIQRRLAGTVTLRIHVDADGLPLEVSVENSSGHAILDEAAITTVQKRWRFVPATRGGQPVEGWALVPVVFVLQQ